MRNNRAPALTALVLAGLLWGTTVPLTKLVLPWLGPGWLTVVRFTVAALLLAWPARRHLRAALTPGILGTGAIGYGMVIILQNAGIQRTSVSHAALLVGAVPVIVALITVALGRGRVSPTAWAGFALAVGGVGLVAADGGGAASLSGDGLVVVSLVLSAVFVVVQPGLLAGRSPVAVTAVQFAAAAVATGPLALVLEEPPSLAPNAGTVVALVGLVLGGTLAPFTLFAYGQARVSAEAAGAFLNLEPLVGAAAGAIAFDDPVGWAQAVGAVAILLGIALTTTRLTAVPAVHNVDEEREVHGVHEVWSAAVPVSR